MCDTEHMFECPNPKISTDTDDSMEVLNDLDINRFLQHTMQVEFLSLLYSNTSLQETSENQTVCCRCPLLRGKITVHIIKKNFLYSF